jgi:hypothetical protein
MNEFDTWYGNWQNPRAVPIPEGPFNPALPIPEGDMMPPRGKPSALRWMKKDPLEFRLPSVVVPEMQGAYQARNPQIDIPTRGLEMLRAAGNQPRMLPYSGADVGVVAERPVPPPRPVSGAVPVRLVTGGPAAIPSSASAVSNASALVPAQQAGGVRPAFGSIQPPNFIEGEFSRVDTRPVPANSPPVSGGGIGGGGAGGGSSGGRGTIYAGHEMPRLPGPTPPKAPLMSGVGVANGLVLAGENVMPAAGMLGNIASNYLGTPMGIIDAMSLGYEQAKYDEMTSEGRQQFYPDGRPVYQGGDQEPFNPQEYQELQKQHPFLGPIIGPAVAKLYEPGGLLAESEPARRLRESEQQAERDDLERKRLGNRTATEERWSAMNAKNTFRPSKSSSDTESPSPATDMEERWRRMTSPNSNTIEPADKSQRQYLEMVARGFKPVEQDYVASGNTPPADIHYKEEDGKTRYEIPGLNAIGGGPGYAEFQGKRKGGGSFSVVPGLSQVEKQRVAEIMGREKQQRQRDELASFMNQFTQPPDGMNEMQAKLWELQQQQLQHFVNAQTEAQQQTRLAEIKAAQDQAAARQAQAQWEAEHGLRQQVEQAKAVNDGMSMRNQALNQAGTLNVQQQRVINDALKPYRYEHTTTGQTMFDAASFNKDEGITELPTDRTQAITGQLYYDPATGEYVIPNEEGPPIFLSPRKIMQMKLGY